MSALDTVRHIVIILLTGFVAFFSFSNEISLFSFHPPLMLTGFLLCMTEAILVFSNDSAFTKKLTSSNRLDFHGLLQFCAGVCIALGFISISYSKIGINSDDEPSFHSNVGYTACILSGGAFSGGILARFGGFLKLPVNIIKMFHAIFGTLSYYLALNAICSGLNSIWLQNHVSQNVIYGLIGVVIVIGITTMYRPVRGIFTRVSDLFSKTKQT